MFDSTDMALAAGTAASATALITPYVLMPALSRFIPVELAPPAEGVELEFPAISVLVPAMNEGEGLADTIESLFAQNYPGVMEILVGDDGSTDDTASIARRYANRGVRLLTRAENRGKWHTLSELVAAARHDIVVLTDCGSELSEGALHALTRRLHNPDVGAVSCRYVVSERGTQADYWSHATNLSNELARRGALCSAHGALWAARRDLLLAQDWSTPFVNDDYVLALRVREGGSLVDYAHEAVAVDPPARTLKAQYARWRRVAHGNYEMLAAHAHLMSPTAGRIAFPLWIKAMRTAGPFFVLAAAAFTIALGILNPWAGVTAMVVGSSLAGVAMSWSMRLRRLAIWGACAQLAYLEGAARFAFGAPPPWSSASAQTSAPVPLSVRFAKRSIDILGASVGIFFGAPIMLLCAIAVRLGSEGPVLFRQERVCSTQGGREQTFTMLKFRTMYVDAETRSGPVWATDDDPRITFVGKLLRKTRLDELPQFFNVLSGDMSLVGPRPERPYFTAKLREVIPGYDDRVSALKPGITGLAQINCGYDTSIDSVREKLTWDMAYAAHLYDFRSWASLEVRVLAETVVVALTGRGAK